MSENIETDLIKLNVPTYYKLPEGKVEISQLARNHEESVLWKTTRS